MDVVFGEAVHCGGQKCGHVQSVIVDVQRHSVLNIVIESHPARIRRAVPLDVLSRSASELKLSCSPLEFERMTVLDRPDVQIPAAGPPDRWGRPLLEETRPPLETPPPIPRLPSHFAVGEVEIAHHEIVRGAGLFPRRLKGVRVETGGRLSHLLLRSPFLIGRPVFRRIGEGWLTMDDGIRLAEAP